MKYQHCIWFESSTSGIEWYVASRDTKHIKRTGTSFTYNDAVKDSELAFWEVEK